MRLLRLPGTRPPVLLSAGVIFQISLVWNPKGLLRESLVAISALQAPYNPQPEKPLHGAIVSQHPSLPACSIRIEAQVKQGRPRGLAPCGKTPAMGLQWEKFAFPVP